jgi:hypothetical protein
MRARLATALLLLLCNGCEKGRAPQRYDLAALLPKADVLSDTTEIDFGTPAAQARLVEGWVPNKITAAESFTWGFGDRSSVTWFIAEPRTIVARFRCHPLEPEFGRGPETIAVANNDRVVETVTLQPPFAEYAVTIPAAALRPGWNRLTFTYGAPDGSWARTVQTEIRPLAVAWDGCVSGARQPAAPYSSVTRGSSVLDPRPTVRPIISSLHRAARLAPAPGAGRRRDVAPSRSTRPPAPHGPLRCRQRGWVVRCQSERRIRVSLRSLSDGVDPSLPLRLIEPRIVTPPSPAEAPARSAAPRRSAGRPNIIVYLIDTLRADHLGAYGYARATSPSIDAFAARATLFANARAQTSWTRTSIASIFTGRRPHHHGVNDRDDALPETAVTLAELLRQQGYSTAGFTTNGNVVSALGFGQGFDIYQYLAGRDENGRPLGIRHPQRSDELNTRALTWLAERPRDQPFFLYLHAIDPHYPYTPPPSVRARLAAGVDPSLGTLAMLAKLVFLQHVASDEELSGIVQLYDAQIAFNDRSFGILCRKLKWQGLFDDALIVLLADHGEEFLDHGGWEHGRSLYDEMLRVPLVFKWPGQRKAAAESPAQLVDIRRRCSRSPEWTFRHFRRPQPVSAIRAA